MSITTVISLPPVTRAKSAAAAGATLLLLGLAVACHPAPSVQAPPPETRAQCTERLHAFGEALARLPDRSVASAARADLPVSTLGAQPGPGPVLEISEAAAAIDGTKLDGATLRDRAARLKDWAARTFPSAAPTPTKGGPAIYVATSASTDVQTLREYFGAIPASVDLRLLVRTPKAPKAGARAPADTAEDDFATRLLLEPEPARREAIAQEAYGALADCSALSAAAASVRGRGPVERWPALKAVLREAVPSCECSKVDTARLLSVVSAEQQAGAGAVGFVPAAFLRDERCGASMPLRSLQKLIGQLEQFDAEFAGTIQHDAFEFGDVVTNDRLKVYFCNALPGETLAAKERARATLYLRVPGEAACEPWRFEPLSPGSPMGTLRRAAGAWGPALAYHYWQAAEELRVFGPVDAAAPSKPTDRRDWTCEETHKLTGIGDDAIELSDSRWYFDEAACRKAPASSRPSPCVQSGAATLPEAEAPPPAGSATHR